MHNLTSRLTVAIAGPAITLASLALASRADASPDTSVSPDTIVCNVYVDSAGEAWLPDCDVYASLPVCAYEDGNPGGNPCVWTSPRTGLRYFNDGSNYRD